MKPIPDEPNVEAFMAMTPEEIPVHLKQGKAYLAAGGRREAVKEFGSILKVAPGNMEARLWMRTAKEAIAKPEEAPLVEPAKPRYCVYMAMGLVSYRQCTGDYNCLSCEFDGQIRERIAGEEAELIEALERYKSLPGNQKLCRYTLKGDVSYRICSRFLQCDTCEFNQMIEDALQQQLIQRQQASCSKRQLWNMAQEVSGVDAIVGKYQADRSALIQVLLDIQRQNRWLPKQALKQVSRSLGIALTQIYHITTFYKAFSLTPKGRHSITVCLGTACHVRGAPRLLDKVSDSLKVKDGETSADMQFSLDTVRCLGCCALGPVMVVDGEYYGKPSERVVEQIISAKKTEP